MATRTEPPAQDGRLSAAAEVLGGWRARAADLADGFRRSDRFFKMRAGIVAAWAVLSLLTLWGSCATPGQHNALGADVQVNRDSIMGTQLLVRNDSDRNWEDVVLTLDDGWRYAQPTLRPQDLVVLSVSSFRKGDEAPPRDHRPRALRISCRQGSGRFDLR
ncbi:hypothetical protein [Anaeromyxobacter diazotrophicus]|uniref:Uncharacterized protein n=1 Tax=Anaeromyxobacter diazotrophicus TaxID=2590199 RepID=A0A7I9VLK7_9BACT|nr:hypothetical protein [Anaeromyxobacter diazotrophicus]GEJ57284.1 hypothetical protein AMYX_20250 [Anaeromyxobacter diazotrophicus]